MTGVQTCALPISPVKDNKTKDTDSDSKETKEDSADDLPF